MNIEPGLAERRLAARAAQIDAIAAATSRYGATAFHVIGSLGRQSGDALSDVDAWLTFPDEAIDDAVRRRFDLYREIGDVLIIHEAVGNRPVGGVFSLVLYLTDAGPLEVDWSLAPQRSSGVVPPVMVVDERVPVPRGGRLIDSGAQQEYTRGERIDWLICMLFVAIKMIVRDKEYDFPRFLERSYRDVGDVYQFDGMTVTSPTSLPNVGAMLRQLHPYADDRQRRAIEAINDFLRELMHGS